MTVPAIRTWDSTPDAALRLPKASGQLLTDLTRLLAVTAADGLVGWTFAPPMLTDAELGGVFGGPSRARFATLMFLLALGGFVTYISPWRIAALRMGLD